MESNPANQQQNQGLEPLTPEERAARLEAEEDEYFD